MTRFFFLIFILIFSACSTFNKKDCTDMNWNSKGREDGSRGERASQFDKYQKQCHEFGISIPQDEYLKGREAGLGNFCTYGSGHTTGSQGFAPYPECAKFGPSFQEGFSLGTREFERKKGIKAILTKFSTKECIFNSDCAKDGICAVNKCENSDSPCNFNSDCKIEGHCSSESDFLYSIREWVSVNVCKY